MPDGYSRILRLYVFCPSGHLDYGSALLRCKMRSLPFLGLLAPRAPLPSRCPSRGVASSICATALLPCFVLLRLRVHTQNLHGHDHEHVQLYIQGWGETFCMMSSIRSPCDAPRHPATVPLTEVCYGDVPRWTAAGGVEDLTLDRSGSLAQAAARKTTLVRGGPGDRTRRASRHRCVFAAPLPAPHRGSSDAARHVHTPHTWPALSMGCSLLAHQQHRSGR